MPVQEAPNDDDVRQTYNFAPGYHGLVYRAETSHPNDPQEKDKTSTGQEQSQVDGVQDVKYKLQAMQWGQ